MDRLFVLLQQLLPQHTLSRLIYALSRVRARPFKDFLIGLFMRGYQPRLDDALEPDPRAYASFNDFFTRALRTDARPLHPDPLRVISPCDGTLSIASQLRDGEMLQAKGHRFELEALLAGEERWAGRLRNGLYATIYLAPYNYHRVHMPLAGRLEAAWHVPGRLFSVNRVTAERVSGLFARNERLVCAFEGDHGPFVVVLVGALFVGSMSTVWHGEVTPWRAGHTRAHATGRPARTGLGRAAAHDLIPTTRAEAWQPRGAELGRFNMGSTVILLLPPGLARWDQTAQPGARLQVGQSLGALWS